MSTLEYTPRQFNQVRKFVQRAKPQSVRVQTQAGERIVAAATGQWSQITKTILLMHPIALEALDGKEHVLSSLKLDFSDAGEGEVIESKGQLQSDLVLMSKLLADAYKHSTQVAFGQLVEVVRLAVDRLDRVEAAYLRSFKKAARRAAGEEDEEETPLKQILESVAAGYAQRLAAGTAPDEAEESKEDKNGAA